MNENKLPERKHPRLKTVDYGRNGYYFITVCAKDRKQIFSQITAMKSDHEWISKNDVQIVLTNTGRIIREKIEGISVAYEAISVDLYVIMPDHIHLLIKINSEDGNDHRKSLNTAIGALKSLSSREAGFPLCQVSFNDHIIRNSDDLKETRKYIYDNPIRWLYKNK